MRRDPFAAVDPTDNHKQRSAQGGLALGASRGVQFAVSLGTMMVLARVLTPADFGLFALALILANFVSAFRDFGLPLALVRERELDHERASRVFWLSVKLALGLALFMCALSPLLAWWFDEPDLIPIVALLALGIAASGSAHTHRGLLERRLGFRALGALDVGATVIASLVAIVAALNGAGYWALAVQQFCELSLQALLLWRVSGWRPGSFRRHRRLGRELRSLLSFGRDTTLVSLIGEGADQIDRLLVGRIAGIQVLGFYQLARRLAEVPSLQLVAPIKNVAVASFSPLQNDPDRYRAAARTAFGAVFALILPLMAFLTVRAEDVVMLVAGPQWHAAVPFFQLLAIALFFRASARLTTWIYLAEGKTRRRIKWSLAAKTLEMAAIGVGAFWGPIGVGAACAISYGLLAYPDVYYCLATSPIRHRDFWGSAWRPAVASIGAAIALVGFPDGIAAFPDGPLALRLFGDGLAYGAIYAVIWLLTPGGVRGAFELLELLRAALGLHTTSRA